MADAGSQRFVEGLPGDLEALGEDIERGGIDAVCFSVGVSGRADRLYDVCSFGKFVVHRRFKTSHFADNASRNKK
jgi:hypothetical protein